LQFSHAKVTITRMPDTSQANLQFLYFLFKQNKQIISVTQNTLSQRYIHVKEKVLTPRIAGSSSLQAIQAYCTV